MRRRLFATVLVCTVTLFASGICAGTAAASSRAFTVDGNVALQSFVALTNGHVRETLDALEAFASTAAAHSGKWSSIEGPLRVVVARNLQATIFYATPNGRYWVVGKGLQAQRVSDRAYFKAVFGGKKSVGDLVVSRSTNTPVVVVAVPVRANGKVVGLLGSGIDLRKLNAVLTREMGVGPGYVFWALDAKGITALHSDPSNIMRDALKIPVVGAVLARALRKTAGASTYSFNGKKRTVLYRRSALTDWAFGFGVIQ